MKIKTTILVEPRGKERSRWMQTPSGKVFSYTPAKTAFAEKLIRESVMALEQRFGDGTAIKLEATFYRQRPKSLPKKVELPISRPDLDNYYKLLADSLQKYVYRDDSQITTAIIKKRFGTPPRIELILEEDLNGETEK